MNNIIVTRYDTGCGRFPLSRMATYVVAREFGLGVHQFIRPPIDSFVIAGARQYDMPGAERRGRKTEFSPQKTDSWRNRVRKFFNGKRTKRQTADGDISHERQKSPARVARSQSWGAREAVRAEKGRAASASFNEQSPVWETQVPSAGAQGASELVRLTLRPKGSVLDVEVHQVTLRRRVEGFGVHLSAGLPPITVTFVEPGGEAEQAGVCVGDLVMEVNGYDCLQAGDITRLLELKMLIQQVEITEARNGSSGSKEEITVDNDTWKEIKARQIQDEYDSQKSSDVELTLIDDVSDDNDEATVHVRASVQIPKGDKMKAEITAIDSGKKAATSSTIGPKKKSGKKRRKKKVKMGDNRLNSNLPSGGSNHPSGSELPMIDYASGGSNALGDEDGGREILSAEDDGRIAVVANNEDVDDGSKLPSSEDGGWMLHGSEYGGSKAQSAPDSEDDEVLKTTHKDDGIYQPDVKKQFCGQEKGSRVEEGDGTAVNQTGDWSNDFNRSGAQESVEGVSQLSGIDLSNVPWTAPSLGLREGRAKRELHDRRLSKRHPASQQLSLLRGQDESGKLTMTSVILVGEPAASDSGGKKRGEKLGNPLGERSGSDHRANTVGELPMAPASTESGVPEWVTIAQVKAKRTHSLLDNNSFASPPPSAEGKHNGNTCLPRQGHVAEKLAFFKNL